MKKITAFILCTILIFYAFSVSVYAAPEFDNKNIKAKSYMLVDANSGNVLYETGADTKIYPASTTKILTTILALEQADLEAEVTVGNEINEFTKNSSLMGLKVGEKVKVNDLIYGMMLVSGNDAANTIAIHMSGSKEGFAEMMNNKAKELGMENSNFMNASGKQNDEHYSTAADMAKVTLYAMKNPDFAKIANTKSYILPPTNKRSEPKEIINTNKLLLEEEPEYYSPANGVKTGSTTSAGDCLVASAVKNNTSLLALVYSVPNNAKVKRWQIAKDLFEYGFENFKTADISSVINSIKLDSVKITDASLNDSQSGYLELIPSVGADGRIYHSGSAEEIDAIENGAEIEKIITVDENITAPVTKGQVCGKVEFKLNDATLFTADLLASRDVAKMTTDEINSAAPVRTQEPLTPNEINTGSNISPWWWLLIPAVLMVLFLIRIAYVSKKRKKRFRKRPQYHYRIK